MSRRCLASWVGVLAFVSLAVWSAAAEAEKADAAGWIDLFNGQDLTGWKRAPILPDKTLNPKNPWLVDPINKVLLCDGVGVKEMLLHEKQTGDGVFHVEWRFRPIESKPADYNSGIYVRTRMDGTIWHQVQVAHQDKAPRYADIFGDTKVEGGGVKRVTVEGKGRSLVKEPGQWNTYDITCTGKEISVKVNDTLATTWKDCLVPKGHVGLQAELYFIEFRNMKYKELK